MTIKGFIKVLEEQVRMATFFSDPYEKGYHDALKMVIANLKDMEEKKEVRKYKYNKEKDRWEKENETN